MCKLCGINTDEHPPGCCNLANLTRMAHGGEVLPSGPFEMGVRPPRGRTYVRAETFQDIEDRREKVNEFLKKYEEE